MDSEPTPPPLPPPLLPLKESALPPGVCLVLGGSLFFFSLFLSTVIQSPIPLLLAGTASLAALPFKGYRLIFAGFVGVPVILALAVVVFCGPKLWFH